MPDAWGPTVEELEMEIYGIRHEIELRWRRWARQVYRRTGNPTELLTLKEFQSSCPNLPPTRPA